MKQPVFSQSKLCELDVRLNDVSQRIAQLRWYSWRRSHRLKELTARREQIFFLHMLPQLAMKFVSDWQTRTHAPSFRLPPGHALTNWLQAEGYLPRSFWSVESRYGLEQLDQLTRDLLDDIPAPFAPLKTVREPDADLIAFLAEHAETVQASFCDEDRQAIHGWIHPAAGGSGDRFRRLLDDPRLVTTLPANAVVWRTYGLSSRGSGKGTSVYDAWAESNTRHLGLQAGDVVSFRHAISASLKTHPVEGITSDDLDWTHTGDDPTWPPPIPSYTSLRMELAPLRGFYISPALSKEVGSHLAEQELVIPPDSYWRVTGWNDLMYQNRPGHVDQVLRHPTVHMIQVEPETIDRGPVIDMSPHISPDRTA